MFLLMLKFRAWQLSLHPQCQPLKQRSCLTDAAKQELFSAGSAAWAIAPGENKDKGKQEGERGL